MRTLNLNALFPSIDVAFSLPSGSFVIQHVHCSLSCTVGSALQELTLSERQQTMVRCQVCCYYATIERKRHDISAEIKMHAVSLCV